MGRYAIRRIASIVPTVIVVSFLTFAAMHLIPGDLAYLHLGDASFERAEELEAFLEGFRAKHGLDRPLIVQYGDWALGMLTGDPGRSMVSYQPIVDELKLRLPVTLHFVAFAWTFTVFFGLAPGVVAAVLQDTKVDHLVRTFVVLADSFPTFFLLTLLLLVPAMYWGYAPPTGYTPFWEDPVGAFLQYAPPAFVVAVGSAFLVRITRSSMMEVLRSDFIRTARAKGLQERTVVLRHALRNSLIPIVTVLGTAFAGMLNGTVIVEHVMAFPGLGEYTLRAVAVRDYPVVMTMTMYTAVIVMLFNLIVDLSYAFLDPRIVYK